MERVTFKHLLAIRWFHWVNFPLLAIMIWSGLLILWANNVYGSFGHDAQGHPRFMLVPDALLNKLHLNSRLAEGMAWHFAFAWLFAINGLLYVAYTIYSGEWRYLLPDRHCFVQAIQVTLHDLKLRKTQPPVVKYNAAQRIAYTLVVLMGGGSLLTGVAIYKPASLHWLTSALGGYEWARWEHYWLTVGYVVFFLIHVGQVIRAGWNNFRSMISGYEIIHETKAVPDAGR